MERKYHPVLTRYSADKDGNVYGIKGIKLQYKPRADGYINLDLRIKPTDSIKIYAHVFVFECFFGLYDRRVFEIDHIDGVKSNDAISNLKKMAKLEHKRKTAMTNPHIGRKSGHKG